MEETNSGESSAISRITSELSVSVVMHTALIRLSAKYYATLPEGKDYIGPGDESMR